MEITVSVLGTGGTIASTQKSDVGTTPSESVEEIVEMVDERPEQVSVSTENLFRIDSSNMDFERISEVGDAIRREVSEGATGIVVTHGTDTIEETAYYLDLVLDVDVPVVLTGAQLPADAISPDGPRNIYDALRLVSDDRVGTGVYVTFNGMVHSARYVTKEESASLSAFSSSPHGPLGEFTPTGLHLYREPQSYSVSIPEANGLPPVEMIPSAAGMDGRQVERAVSAGVKALVVVGTGLGNVTADLGRELTVALKKGLQVVMTTRCHQGRVAPVYGGEGGGKELASQGVIFGEALQAQKARVKLALALGATDDQKTIRGWFDTAK